MDAVTYPDPRVSAFMRESLIAVRLPHDHKPLAERFQVKWTPTLVTLDAEGREHHRNVGFLPPEDLIPMLLLGRAKVDFDRDDFFGSLRTLELILKDHASSDSAPEAIYLQGVNRYKSTHDPSALREAYEMLNAEYPQSEWTKRAYPYRLLKLAA